MNDRRAREIDEFFVADAIEPTTVPFPGSGDRIDECRQHQGKDHELAKLDVQKGVKIPQLIFSCCNYIAKKEAIEKLIELGKQREADKKVAKSVLDFQDQFGDSFLGISFDMAAKYRVRNNFKCPSGPMLREIEESIFYLLDLAKCFNLNLKKILNLKKSL